jgi:hypothetical protein
MLMSMRILKKIALQAQIFLIVMMRVDTRFKQSNRLLESAIKQTIILNSKKHKKKRRMKTLMTAMTDMTFSKKHQSNLITQNTTNKPFRKPMTIS